MKHRDFVILVKGAEEINALVVFSHTVTTPATQTVPAFDTEYLTVIYTDPVAGAAWPSKDKILNSLHVEISVPPASAGKFFGWKDVGPSAPPPPVAEPAPEAPGSDSYTHGWDKGFAQQDGPYGIGKEYLTQSPNPDAAAYDNPNISGPDGLTDAQRGYKWGSEEHLVAIGAHKPTDEHPVEVLPTGEIVPSEPTEAQQKPTDIVDPTGEPSAADLDAHAGEQTIADATS